MLYLLHCSATCFRGLSIAISTILLVTALARKGVFAWFACVALLLCCFVAAGPLSMTAGLMEEAYGWKGVSGQRLTGWPI
jgi:hypothetical protein